MTDLIRLSEHETLRVVERQLVTFDIVTGEGKDQKRSTHSYTIVICEPYLGDRLESEPVYRPRNKDVAQRSAFPAPDAAPVPAKQSRTPTADPDPV